MQKRHIEPGDRLKLSGGYSFEPEWLGGKQSVSGTLLAFVPGQNEKPAALISLDDPIVFEDITGSTLVLELRYVGADWEVSGIVHVELCDFIPGRARWQDRRKGQWAESHAQYEWVAT